MRIWLCAIMFIFSAASDLIFGRLRNNPAERPESQKTFRRSLRRCCDGWPIKKPAGPKLARRAKFFLDADPCEDPRKSK